MNFCAKNPARTQTLKRWKQRKATIMNINKFVLRFVAMTILISSCSNTDNRYEVTQSSESEYTRTLLVDKKEGTVWALSRDGKWLNIGTPPKSAPEIGDELQIEK